MSSAAAAAAAPVAAAPALATIGILSIGGMGLGIAKLLRVHGFAVATNCHGRSVDTVERAEAALVTLYPTDEELVRNCDVILSVAPPRDATEIAARVVSVLSSSPSARAASAAPLYFADMNAIAPSTVRAIGHLFTPVGSSVRFVDGSIIGGPPSLRADGSWSAPVLYTSGPHRLEDVPGGWGARLSEVLRVRHIADDVGAASGLKMCFASLSKGYTAVAVQAYTSARAMGVLGELRTVLGEVAPQRAAETEGGLVGMAPKAYRWVREMEEISKTHAEEGGFAPELFIGAAGVYRAVAEDTVLGEERIGHRRRGTTAEDIAVAMVEGLGKKREAGE
ncbi:6-phosphogluconate dehydrogenase [Cordyceps fumosorosea ARSEF 2679]|uniref:6-phosphogluconate dehydrogenase n=1 Tax=Cordyceps fumosorosea (strain ARSEF 2679) TaxID=1081104 RepID=A0A162JR73_CORFA|nr:6-phosphogluconate dehydrogenase [Cordyceps fumosorosea ARSEF 2679]OAA72602.1 6-phosphogluconate dehydrogenase [Cordyceps fumosorosea ARSEF 2679]